MASVIHMVCVSVQMLLKTAGSRTQMVTEILRKELQGGWSREKSVSLGRPSGPTAVPRIWGCTLQTWCFLAAALALVLPSGL